MNDEAVLSDGADAGREIITLGGGCFWCLEAVYAELRGVTRIECGYMGGHVAQPAYEQVCRGDTGHAEVVRLAFDAQVVSCADILQVFFVIHDPTTPDRQGNDVGPQYRSVIFHHSARQRQLAADAIRQLDAAQVWPAPIVTALEPASTFWPAEAHHQAYYRRNPQQPYCSYVIEPKVHKFRRAFIDRLKSDAGYL